MPRPANAFTRRPLPSDVYYTPRNGGMYVRWNGRPEGTVSYTHDRDLAYGRESDFEWSLTPYQGANGSCRLGAILALAAEYSEGQV